MWQQFSPHIVIFKREHNCINVYKAGLWSPFLMGSLGGPRLPVTKSPFNLSPNICPDATCQPGPSIARLLALLSNYGHKTWKLIAIEQRHGMYCHGIFISSRRFVLLVSSAGDRGSTARVILRKFVADDKFESMPTHNSLRALRSWRFTAIAVTWLAYKIDWWQSKTP